MFQFSKGESTNQSKTCVLGFYYYLQTSAVPACGVSAADMGEMCAAQRLQESYKTAGSGKKKQRLLIAWWYIQGKFVKLISSTMAPCGCQSVVGLILLERHCALQTYLILKDKSDHFLP